jgi:hypothetical protein
MLPTFVLFPVSGIERVNFIESGAGRVCCLKIVECKSAVWMDYLLPLNKEGLLLLSLSVGDILCKIWVRK